MASEDRSTKLPPPPTIGGGSKAPAAPHISPPALGQGKADARAVGVDTSFIDGLTAGLLDELPGGSPAPAAPELEPESEAASKVDEAVASPPDDDDLERLATRAFSAMNEDGEVAQPAQPLEADDQDQDQDQDDAEDVAGALPFPPPRAATEVAEAQPPPAPAAAASGGIPRSWLFAGVGAAIALLVVWKVSSGDDAASVSAEDRVAALEPPGEEPGAGGAEGVADREGGNDQPGEGGGGRDQADSSRDADDPDGVAADGRDADENAEAVEAVADADGSADEADDADDGAAVNDEDVETIELAEASDTQSTASSTRSGGSPKPLPATSTSTDRAAEDEMSAEELLQAAREAYKKGKVRDSYRLANLSNQKKKSDEALELKAKSACRMKNKDLAKSAYKALPMGEKRRDVRQTCREHDIRLGL